MSLKMSKSIYFSVDAMDESSDGQTLTSES